MLEEFPITRRWPPQHPDRIQLYSLNTPNGVKVSILLEEAVAGKAGGGAGVGDSAPPRLGKV